MSQSALGVKMGLRDIPVGNSSLKNIPVKEGTWKPRRGTSFQVLVPEVPFLCL